MVSYRQVLSALITYGMKLTRIHNMGRVRVGASDLGSLMSARIRDNSSVIHYVNACVGRRDNFITTRLRQSRSHVEEEDE